MHIYANISLNFLKREMFRTKVAEKIKTHIFMSDNTFSPENRAVYETMWKNRVEPDRPQMTIQYGACALHAG